MTLILHDLDLDFQGQRSFSGYFRAFWPKNVGEKVIPDHGKASACTTPLTVGDIDLDFQSQRSFNAIYGIFTPQNRQNLSNFSDKNRTGS